MGRVADRPQRPVAAAAPAASARNHVLTRCGWSGQAHSTCPIFGRRPPDEASLGRLRGARPGTRVRVWTGSVQGLSRSSKRLEVDREGRTCQACLVLPGPAPGDPTPVTPQGVGAPMAMGSPLHTIPDTRIAFIRTMPRRPSGRCVLPSPRQASEDSLPGNRRAPTHYWPTGPHRELAPHRPSPPPSPLPRFAPLSLPGTMGASILVRPVLGRFLDPFLGGLDARTKPGIIKRPFVARR